MVVQLYVQARGINPYAEGNKFGQLSIKSYITGNGQVVQQLQGLCFIPEISRQASQDLESRRNRLRNGK